jgi:recombination protein RecA
LALREDVLAWQAKLNNNKKLGAGTVCLASDMVVPRRFLTGSLALDVALGGGFPGNQWTEIIGQESSGKTAITMKTIARNQQLDPEFTTLWVAAEHYDTDQASALGVDNDRVLVTPVRKMELALEFLDDALESKAFDGYVLDSFPALLTDEEYAKGMDEATMAIAARLFNKFWRKAGESGRRDPYGSDRAFVGIIINQFRDKIGSAFLAKFNPQTTPGGHGKDYAYYTRLKVARGKYLTEDRGLPDPVTVGQEIAVTTIKNKSAAPNQTAHLEFYFRNAPFTGFSRGEYDLGKEYVDLGVMYGVIQKKGAHLYWREEHWTSRDDAKVALHDNDKIREELGAEVLEVSADPNYADKVAAQTVSEATDSGAKRRKR